MFDIGSGSFGNIVQPHQPSQIDERASDWELVLRETHHRMNNTLTLLGATVRRDLLRGGSKERSAAVDRFERRVVAFGRLYQLLSGGSDLRTNSAAGYFEDLSAALSAAILEPAGIRCEAAIENGTLSAAQCHRLGLIITELVTNAAKHAFPGHQGGIIRIESLRRDGCWCFSVADNGVGATGSLQGTGSRILEGLARSIRAQMHVETGRCGTTVTVVVPVER